MTDENDEYIVGLTMLAFGLGMFALGLVLGYVIFILG